MTRTNAEENAINNVFEALKELCNTIEKLNKGSNRMYQASRLYFIGSLIVGVPAMIFYLIVLFRYFF